MPLGLALLSATDEFSEETQPVTTGKSCSTNAYLVKTLSRLRRNNSFSYTNWDSTNCCSALAFKRLQYFCAYSKAQCLAPGKFTLKLVGH